VAISPQQALMRSLVASQESNAGLLGESKGRKPQVQDRDSCPPPWPNSAETICAVYGGP
jgi:hypothetical protein